MSGCAGRRTVEQLQLHNTIVPSVQQQHCVPVRVHDKKTKVGSEIGACAHSSRFTFHAAKPTKQSVFVRMPYGAARTAVFQRRNTDFFRATLGWFAPGGPDNTMTQST